MPSSSPMSSICAIEIEAILFLFMVNCYKSLFKECITIIVLIMERTRNQPPYCLHQLQEKIAFRLPRSGCLGTPLTLPQSLYGWADGRTDVRLRQNQNFSDQRVTKFAFPWCSASSASSAKNHLPFCSSLAMHVQSQLTNPCKLGSRIWVCKAMNCANWL